MRLHRTLIIVGAILLIASGPMLWRQGREAYLGGRTYDRYKVEVVDGTSTTVNGHSVSATATEIVSGSRTFARHTGSEVAVLKLFDRNTGKVSALTVERTGARAKESWRYRIIAVDSSGETTVDEFAFLQRDQRPYRVVTVRFVSPEAIGFADESLQMWPSIVYPIMYPWVTAVVGFVILALAMLKYRPTAAT
jgi:hypothetical protein